MIMVFITTMLLGISCFKAIAICFLIYKFESASGFGKEVAVLLEVGKLPYQPRTSSVSLGFLVWNVIVRVLIFLN